MYENGSVAVKDELKPSNGTVRVNVRAVANVQPLEAGTANLLDLCKFRFCSRLMTLLP